jgi:hypothetical protein
MPSRALPQLSGRINDADRLCDGSYRGHCHGTGALAIYCESYCVITFTLRLIAQSAGWGVMTSHRSGETEDTFIAGADIT